MFRFCVMVTTSGAYVHSSDHLEFSSSVSSLLRETCGDECANAWGERVVPKLNEFVERQGDNWVWYVIGCTALNNISSPRKCFCL